MATLTRLTWDWVDGGSTTHWAIQEYLVPPSSHWTSNKFFGREAQWVSRPTWLHHLTPGHSQMFKHRIQSLSDLVDMLSRVPINCHVMMIFEFSPLSLKKCCPKSRIWASHLNMASSVELVFASFLSWLEASATNIKTLFIIWVELHLNLTREVRPKAVPR